jgi:hypothetical protein
MNNNIEKIKQIKQLEQSIKTMEENLRVAETRYQGYSSIPKQQVMEQILNLTNSIRKKKEELNKLLQSSSSNNSSSLEDRLASIRETSYQNKLVTDRLTAGLEDLRRLTESQPVAQTSFMDRLTQRLTGNSNNKKEITVDDLEDLLADVELPKGGKRRRKRKSNKKRNTHRVNKKRHTRRLNNRRRK